MSSPDSKDVGLNDNGARYMKDHEYTWETIYHFNCGECMNWWSYASTLEYLKPDTIVRLSCPHCGYRTKVKLKENG